MLDIGIANPALIYPTSFMFIEIASAAGATGLDPSAAYDIRDVIQVVVALVVLASGFLCVIFVIWGGVMLILSGGKDEKVKPAVSSIRYAVVGLIVIILSIFVVPKAGDLLGLQVSQYVTPDIIFSRIGELSRRIFGGSTSSSYGTTSIDGSSNLPDDFSDL